LAHGLGTTASLIGFPSFASSLPLLRPLAASSAIFKKPVLDCTVIYLSTRHYSKRRTMPPKKAVKEEKILLGRPGNNLKSGIVGCLLNHALLPCFEIANCSSIRLDWQTLASLHSSRPSPSPPSVTLQYASKRFPLERIGVADSGRRTFPMPPSSQRRLASSFPMSGLTGSARNITPNPGSLPISHSMTSPA